MRVVVTAAALAASFFAFVLIAGTGLVLAGVEQSGERGAGMLMTAAAALGFGAVLLLAFAPHRLQRSASGRAIAAVLALVGALPVAALAAAAFIFVGVPLGSLLPRLDWTLFAVGLVFAAGAAAIVALGYRRMTGRARPLAERPDQSHQASPEMQARPKIEADDPRSIEIDRNVRVRRA